MTFPKMSFATFARLATIIGFPALAGTYSLLLYAAALIHTAAVLVVVAFGLYYVSVFAFTEAKVAGQYAMAAEFRRVAEEIEKEQGNPVNVAGGAALHPQARERMH